MDIFEPFRTLTMSSILLRSDISLVIGGVLGFERERRRRPAGLRTFMLVCFGSAAVMMTNQYVFQYFHTSDLVRMGAQVISGIGFLGAGTIMITRHRHIRGITTAAGLWTAGCLGLATGIGFYEMAIVGLVVTITVVAGFHRLGVYIQACSSEITAYIEYSGSHSFSSFLKAAREKQFEIEDLQINKDPSSNFLSAIATIKSLKKRTHAEIVDELSSIEGTTYVEELE